ncbi:MAG: hypothetical protein H0T73_06790 [Ardenticatenales bacterium]|nr:hypothetical protein [Ardenticatenales bacterium]
MPPRAASDLLLSQLTIFTEQVTPGKAFGIPCLYANGYLFAGLAGEALLVKLPEPERTRALAFPGAHLFDPSGRNMPLREWVQIPLQHAALWNALARAALAYIRALPPKIPRAKRGKQARP